MADVITFRAAWLAGSGKARQPAGKRQREWAEGPTHRGEQSSGEFADHYRPGHCGERLGEARERGPVLGGAGCVTRAVRNEKFAAGVFNAMIERRPAQFFFKSQVAPARRFVGTRP